MATTDDKGQKSLTGHPEPGRIEAHKEAAQLREHVAADDAEPVPAATADVDETPKFVQYGAAVLLGLAFGVGCYMWFGNGETSITQPEMRYAAVPASQYGAVANLQQGALPDPFMSSDPSLDPNYTATGATLRMAADAESVEPAAGNYAVAKPVKAAAVAPGDGTVVYLFEFDSDVVPETRELTAIAKHATSNGLCLDVRAYTDEKGRPAYNQRLSERRAKAIGKYLVAHGVPAEKVSVHGMGATHAYANDAQDRRAEVVEIAR